MTATATGRPAEIRSLTGLRGLAALLVLAHHVQFLFLPQNAFRVLPSIGYVGVTFFFALSGFVLTLADRPGDTARRFFGRRFARVYPLYLLTTLAGVALAAAAGGVDRSDLALNLGLLQAWDVAGSSRDAFVPVSWSLSDEAFFYLLFPLLLPVLQRSRAIERSPLRVLVLLGAVMLVIIVVLELMLSRGLTTYALYLSPPYRLLQFGAGVVCALAVVRGRFRPPGAWTALWVAAAAYAVGAVGHSAVKVLADGALLPQYYLDLLVLPGFLLLIVSLAVPGERQRPDPLGGRVWWLLGRWSYALYLTHLLLRRMLVDRVGVPDLGLLGGLLGYLAFVAVALAVAAALHHGVEQPLERVLRRRLSGPAVPAGSVERAALPRDAWRTR